LYFKIGRRKAKILKEEQSGSSVTFIRALMPVVESFGLSEELYLIILFYFILSYFIILFYFIIFLLIRLKQTSGSASTQMMFHGWEVLDLDPYWVATKDEELEDIGIFFFFRFFFFKFSYFFFRKKVKIWEVLRQI
jgi:ribosome assembly protein 1